MLYFNNAEWNGLAAVVSIDTLAERMKRAIRRREGQQCVGGGKRASVARNATGANSGLVALNAYRFQRVTGRPTTVAAASGQQAEGFTDAQIIRA